MPLPSEFSVSVASLRRELATATTLVWDFETDGLDPHHVTPCGLGIYVPETAKAFYLNCGHMVEDPALPRVPVNDVAAAIAPFFADPSRRAIAHNLQYDARVLYRMGVPIHCQTACTLIRSHRGDENLRQADNVFVHHDHVRPGYGLKELTAVYFKERPPTLESVIGTTNTLFAPPLQVAQYCVADVYNAWRLFERSEARLQEDWKLNRLVTQIDDPNVLVVSDMMWHGVHVDIAEIDRQQDVYLKAIQECREQIWAETGVDWSLRTRDDIRRILRHLNLSEDLSFDPFYEPEPGDAEPSVNSDKLAALIEACPDDGKKRVIAIILAKWQMEHRVNAFLRPFARLARQTDGRCCPSYFHSTLLTTRFSSQPNLQNLPGRADRSDEPWRAFLPESCSVHLKTRKIFAAPAGRVLVQLDFKTAEPRYLALLFQRALEQRDDHLLAAKARLQVLRWQRYPGLMRKKAELADEISNYQAAQIEWPKYFEDPLWLVFRAGGDPYNALLKAMLPEEHNIAKASGGEAKWFKDNRAVGKRGFLALAYGSSASSLTPQLGWSIERTTAAIRSLETEYATLEPLRELTRREVVQLGEVRSLFGRPRRINGFHTLVQPELMQIAYRLERPSRREYQMDIVPLGSTQYGIQAFVKEARRQIQRTDQWSIVLSANWDGAITHLDERDAFIRNVREHHFNNPPFANISFSRVRWVRDRDGLLRELPRLEDAARQAFNALCQVTGGDHLRKAMNEIHREVVKQPKFDGCKFVLSVHDSLIYETPIAFAEDFAKAAAAVMSRRPNWSTIDFPVEVEIGPNLADLTELVL